MTHTTVPLLKRRHLWHKQRHAWRLALALGILTSLATLTLLSLSGWFITAAALAGIPTLAHAHTFNYFAPAAIIRLSAILRTAGRYGERLAAHHAILTTLADLRLTLFKHRLHTAPTHTTAQQMHRLTSDIDTLGDWTLLHLLPWISTLLITLLYWLWLAHSTWQLAQWLALPLVLTSLILPLIAFTTAQPLATAIATAEEQRRTALLHPLSALTALLQWQRWQHFATRFTDSDRHTLRLQQRNQHRSSQLTLLQHSIWLIATALTLWQGSQLLHNHQLTLPHLLAILLAQFGLEELTTALLHKPALWGQSRNACARLNALITTPSPRLPNGSTPLPDTLTLSLHQLTARQPHALIGPNNLNRHIHSGETLIIQGTSGSGKSTLLDTLAGELAPHSGDLHLNGYPLNHWAWQGNIGYLSQQWTLFDATLADNLRLGNPNTDDHALWQVLDTVSLADWARALPQQLNTPLGEYGATVSGGQARRIALARLLLRTYPILLLDEPFAGLDAPLRQALYEKLRHHQRHGILILVSHHTLHWGDNTQQLFLDG